MAKEGRKISGRPGRFLVRKKFRKFFTAPCKRKPNN